MNLNRKHFAEMFRADYITIAVLFDESSSSYPREYTYKAPKNSALAIGDKILVRVDRKGGTVPEFKQVTVREVHLNPEINSAASFNYKWIVGKIDDVCAAQQANVAKDNKLKIAVERLERSLSAITLRREIQAAMNELPAEEIAIIQAMFADGGISLALPGGDA